jgi:predicted component of type VI protein secretion system
MAFITVNFGGKEERKVDLNKPRLVVGREPTCEIPIDNLGISRQHCVFIQRGDAYVVQDMTSANGTFVNGKKITEHFLNDSDEVVIGKYQLVFHNEGQAAGAQAAVDRPAANAGVPDTLNTYVMDGAKIQEQLAKMREKGGGPRSSGANSSVPTAPGTTAKDFAKAMDGAAAPSSDMSSIKTLLIVSMVVNIVLLIAVVVLVIKVVGSKT